MLPSYIFSALGRFSYFRLWREAWAYASTRERRSIILYHLMFALAISIELVQPYIFGRLVNTLQTGGPDLFHDALWFLVAIVLCSCGFWLFHGPARIIERKTAKEIYITYTARCYARLTELPLSWHQDHHSGATINRIQTSALGLQSFVEDGFMSFQSLSVLMGSIGMLLWFNWAIGCVSLAGFALGMGVIIAMNRFMVVALHNSNEAAHQASATFYDFVSNIVSIVILRLQKFSEQTLVTRLNLSMPPWMKQIKLNEWRYFVYTIMNAVMMAVILLGYIKMQVDLHAAVAAGSLITVYLYQEKVGNQGFGFINMHGEWLRSLTNMAATKNILADHTKMVKPHTLTPLANWKEIELRHIHFNYRVDGVQGAGLKDVSLNLRRGERVALLGDSGAGKSTLLFLLRALHAPQQAEMRIDGASAPFDSLSEITTLIPQDPEIFENTIRFNVSFDLDVSDEQVHEAVQLAEFSSVLSQTPKGLDTDIRERGVNLSVGQKQRLALARGIFAAERSDIILLDEPTSSIDLPTEEKIFENIFSHFQGKTIVATLHRLHLLPKFDRIIYLEKGGIVADLPTREALTAEGPIRALYATYQQAAA